MKSKLIFSEYHKPSGVSTVVVRNKYGTFRSQASLHPDDSNYESSFFGCRIAEARCTIATLKEQRKIIKIKIKTLQDFEKTLKSQKSYNPYSFECCKLRKQIYILEKEKCKIEKCISEILENIKIAEVQRQKSIDGLKKALDKKEQPTLNENEI